MRFFGLVLIVLGAAVLYLMGIEGLTPADALDHVESVLGLTVAPGPETGTGPVASAPGISHTASA